MSTPISPKRTRAACSTGARPTFSAAGVSGSDGFRGLRLRQDSDRAEV